MSDSRTAGRARVESGAKPRLASALAALAAGAPCMALSAVAAPACAEERAQRFDIAAQPLSTALLDFARQAKVQLLLPEALLDGATSAEVRGVYEPSAALSRLLKGTGFDGWLEDGAVQLRRAAHEPIPVRRNPRRSSRSTETVVDESIVVVGSNIRGIYPSSSPIDIYTASDIAHTGAVRTEQFIDTLTQNLNTRTQYGPGSTAAFNSEGVNGIDLRGLGASLVLINGRRLPLASAGRTADLSFIPLSAVERVEVLTDGASAIYGADAIGGVVNFVLRSEAEHPETRIDFGSVTEGGLRSGGIAHSIGGRWDRGAAFLSLSARSASALDRMDRDFASAAGRGDLSPADVRYSLVGSFSLDADSRFSLSGDLLAGFREVKTELEVSEQAFLTTGTETENLFLNLGAGYDLSEELQASLIVTYSTRDDRTLQRTISPAGIDSINPDTEYSLLDTTAKLEGRAWRLPGGDMRFSLGGGIMQERFWYRLSGYDLGRSTAYIFAEAFAPILSDAAFAHRLELSLAARYTDYADESQPRLNDFGDHVSPKIGLLWAPADWLSLRGSFSESFRAPALFDLDPTAAVTSVNFLPFRGAPAVVLGAFGPPPSLEPETARTYTAGFDLDVPFASGLRVRATYFNIDYRDRVAVPDPTFGLMPFSDPDRFIDVLFATNSAALIEEILASTTNLFNETAIDLTDPTAAAQLAALPNFVVFDDRLRNLDRVCLDGFDLDLAYGLGTPIGEIRFGSRVTYMMDYTERISANAPTVAVVDTVLRPVDLRGRANIGLTRDRLDAMIAVNYVDDYRNPYSANAESVGSWTTWDARVAFDFGRSGSAFDGASLSFTVLNIFDRPPPFVAASDIGGLGLLTAIGFDRANANPIGRFAAFEFLKRW